MKIYRISIFRKILLLLFFFAVVLIGVYFYLTKVISYSLDLNFLIIFLAIFVVFFSIVSYSFFVKPLQIVLSQMEALISGKPYKRIYTDRIDEIGVLAHFFNQVTKGFSEVSVDIKDRERMKDELAIAAQLQREILPSMSPQIDGLQISAKNKPATELGGDIFNFIDSKDKTYIYIGDVTGHGVAAGLIMTMASSLINVFADSCNSAFDILVNVNHYIKQHVKKAMFLTLVMLSWDKKNKKLSFVGAGHEHILVYRASTGQCEAVLSGGIALGMVPDNSKLIKEVELPFEDGDFVVLYSDGITEARNVNGELYGLERLKAAFLEYVSQYSPDGVNFHIAKNVSLFMEGHVQDDDMTLIVVKCDKNLKDGLKVQDQSITWSE